MAAPPYRALNLVLLGPPGSGKGTQAKMLAERYEIPHISTGDILRDEVARETSLGLEVRSLMEKGELVPDRVMAGILLHRIDRDDCARGFILDGYPRTVEQAGVLDDILGELGRTLESVLLITTPDEVIVRRITGRRSCPQCGRVYHVEHNPPEDGTTCDVCGAELMQRADDREEVVRDRLRVYREKTEPIVDLYGARGLLMEIDGDRPVSEVTREILAALGASVDR